MGTTRAPNRPKAGRLSGHYTATQRATIPSCDCANTRLPKGPTPDCQRANSRLSTGHYPTANGPMPGRTTGQYMNTNWSNSCHQLGQDTAIIKTLPWPSQTSKHRQGKPTQCMDHTVYAMLCDKSLRVKSGLRATTLELGVWPLITTNPDNPGKNRDSMGEAHGLLGYNQQTVH